MSDAFAYKRVAADLRRRMRAGGDLRPGMRLPSQRQLIGIYGVSPTTVRNALILLKQEGYIEAVERSGYYARDRKTEDRLDAVERRLAEVEERLRQLTGEDPPAGADPRT